MSARYRGPIIDSDLHHTWRSFDEIASYIPSPWKELATGAFGSRLPIHPADFAAYRTPGGGLRADSYPGDGSPPGSSYEVLKEQHLDRHNIERVVVGFDAGRNNALMNPYFAQAVVRAINDWTVDCWCGLPDPRVTSMMLIPGQFPEEAATEIRRVGQNRRIVAALIAWNGLGKPLGSQLHDPIFDALQEMDLPLCIHIGAGEHSGMGTGAQIHASGLMGNYYEFHTLFTQMMMHHLTSLVVHGVFEKFPNLRVAAIECGLAWVPWLFWNLDDNFELLRRESPLLRRRPSEYLREHVRFTSQPLDLSPKATQLIDVFEAFGGVEDILCFSSDYPHWDADEPNYVLARLPQHWQEKIFYTNALGLFRWDASSFSEPATAATALA